MSIYRINSIYQHTEFDVGRLKIGTNNKTVGLLINYYCIVWNTWDF